MFTQAPLTVVPALDTAATAFARRPVEAPAPTLRPLALLLGSLAIVAGGISLAALVATLALLMLVVGNGRESAAELLLQAQFDPALKTLLGAAAIAALYVGATGATLAAAAVVGRTHWRGILALSANRASSWRAVAIGGVTLCYGAAVATLLQHRHLSHDGPTNYLLLATIVCNLTLLAPLAEELFFRGWLYTALRARLRFGPTFTVTTLLFAAMHWDASHHRIILVMPLAIALGVLREATGSIRSTFALHALYNGLIVAITILRT